MVSSYQPISDYAVIGDCGTAALVSKAGSIDWLCLPDFCSPSLFARILDAERGGFFSVTLPDLVSAERRYVDETAVLETVLTNEAGRIRITDCMAVRPHARKGADLGPLHEILRRVEVLDGVPEIQVRLQARPDYGATKGEFQKRGQLGWVLQFRQHVVYVSSDFNFVPDEGGLHAMVRREKGRVFWLSLVFESGKPAVLMPLGVEAQARLDMTIAGWRQWCARCTYEGSLRPWVLRSAITLRLLTFSVSGALVAAATTSLPERVGGWMNWDYRYCWPRDSALTLSAFIDCGWRDEADAFFGWLMSAANTRRPYIDVLYDLYGRYRLREKVLALAGYRGSRPVRTGNAASEQRQHDVYGEVLMAIEDWVRHFGKPEEDEQMLIRNLGVAAARLWRQPDYGIWEIRRQPAHYTHSKVMVWYVFDALVRLQEKGFLDFPIEQFRQERAVLRQDIEEHGFNRQRNCFVGVYNGDTVDASLLLLPRCGFVAYDDPRMLGTWEAIQSDLQTNGLILRYPPGFEGSEAGEGALFICNFWAVDYLAGLKRFEEARERLRRLMAHANDVGLYSEGLDTVSGAMTGNIPQSYSHAALINSILALYPAEAGKIPSEAA